MLCFFLLRTDYFQSQFYTGMQKAADTTLNQEAGLLWSGETKKNKSSFKMARKCQKILIFRHTRKKGIKYPYKAKASEKLYLLHTSERKGIGMV